MLLFTSLAAVSVVWGSVSQNQTRYNPAIPGWHSDPSCVSVSEWNNTTYCTTSTFLLTPGLPVYASKDLVTLKLACHALSQETQYPGFFYINVIYKNNILNNVTGLIFKTADPYSDRAWSDPVRYDPKSIDPDLFWDDGRTVCVAIAGTNLQMIDLKTGTVGISKQIWNGTTGTFLEGARLYKKDGHYYLMTAEGGSGMNHSVTIARLRNIMGPT
ncbi:hypothetical protein ETB97_009055 [Aspergillus alliaceus]|uniref:Uncharacterized protein n=1 Tax=Petromyces alliaceus TaxID=209559 RepID=A0A8H6A6Z9_PETAA|nr:hypothetical protein ETB97_009055 [Aspergillus burnettii]